MMLLLLLTMTGMCIVFHAEDAPGNLLAAMVPRPKESLLAGLNLCKLSG